MKMPIGNWAKFALPAFALALVVVWANFALANPTQNPPGGNVTLSSSQWTTSGSNIYYTTGNIAVGTTTIGYPLTVATSSDSLFGLFRNGATYPVIFKAGTDGALVINNGNANHLTIASSGNVGIGTTGPSSLLHLSGGQVVSQGSTPSNAQLRIQGTGSAGTGNDAIILFWTPSNARAIYLDESDSNKLKITGGGATDLVTIDNSGNVGIGTTAPSSTLHVIGDIKATGNIFGAFRGFRAYLSAVQSINSDVWTRVNFNAESFDTNSEYDSATNYRFQPTTAGYYACSASQHLDGINNNVYSIAFYKNGGQYSVLLSRPSGGASGGTWNQTNFVLADTFNLNGSSDYVEVYILHNRGSALNALATPYSWFTCYKLGN